MPRWSEVAVARELLWPPCRKTEWARLQGALAVDAHDCIMVRIPKGSTEYKVVARRPRYDLAGSPQIVNNLFAARRIPGMGALLARHALSPSIPRA